MKLTAKLFCTVLAALALAIAGASVAADAPAPKAKPVEVGDKMVDFELKTLDGKEMSFSKDILGKNEATVLVFMNTNCASCLSEMDAMTNIVLKYGAKVGFFAIAVDMRGADTVGPYSKKNNFKATYLLDPEFTLAPKVGLTYTPSLVIVDKAGVVQFKKGGHKPGDLELVGDEVVKVVKKQ